MKQPKLFLRLDIERTGATLHPSFHYDALPRLVTGDPTDYVLEVHDAEGRRLRRVCLHAEGPGCGCGDARDFPVRIRQAVAYHEGAAKLVLYRCDEWLAEWDVAEPPDVEVECRPDEEDPESVVLMWKVDSADDSERTEYWSLVQWKDRLGTWRGVAPRLRGNSLRVPRFRPGVGRALSYRVLVTSGIATGVAYWEGPCGEDDYRPKPPEVVLVDAGRTAGTHELPRMVTATTVGGGDHPGRIRWFDSDGGELARGSRLDLTRLRPGTNSVSAAVVGADVSVPVAQWLIERTRDDRFLLHIGNIGPDVPADGDQPEGDHDHPHDHHHHPHSHDEGE